MALTRVLLGDPSVSYTIIDMFGVAGEDGTGTAHEFEDGRAERANGVTLPQATWTATEWNVYSDLSNSSDITKRF